MSDAVPIQNRPVQPPVQQPRVQTPGEPPVNQPAALPPISGGNPEHGPISTTSGAVPETPQGSGNDVIKHAPVEVAIPTEVKEVGVTHGSDTEPKLTEEIKKAGVTVSTAVNVPSPKKNTLPKIPLPMTYEEAVIKKKQSKMKDAVKWLAAKIIYQWRKVDPELYK